MCGVYQSLISDCDMLIMPKHVAVIRKKWNTLKLVPNM